MTDSISSNPKLTAILREIATVIGTQPVMGHWPHMRALLDSDLVAQAATEIERLTRDLETGFMQGAYARLKSLQEAESEVERLRASSAIVGELAALVPLSETIEATHTGASLIAWFKERLREGAVSAGEIEQLRANQQLACQTLAAVEFDGQAYKAIARAMQLLGGE